MKRRDVLSLLGGAAVLWPVGASGQPDTTKRVGLVSGFSEAEFSPLADSFRLRMRDLGWLPGQNIAIDVRPASGDYVKLAREAGELISAKVDVLVAMGTPGVRAVQQHSRTVPVVFTLVADPVSQGFIHSLAHPGGNLTGFTNFEFSIVSKWIDIARQIVPGLNRLTLLSNPANPAHEPMIKAFYDAAGRTALIISDVPMRNTADIEEGITAAAQSRSLLIVLPDSFAVVHRPLIVELAERQRLPALYAFRVFPANGGLMSYGLDYSEVYRQAADYTDRILRGTSPSELPVQAPNKFELVLNLKTAKALGLTLPPTLLALADEVIE